MFRGVAATYWPEPGCDAARNGGPFVFRKQAPAAADAEVRQRIRRRALVIASRDDPLAPAASLEPLRDCPAVRLEIVASGGHLGFVGRRQGADRRWLDWRIVEWVVDDEVAHDPSGGT